MNRDHEHKSASTHTASAGWFARLPIPVLITTHHEFAKKAFLALILCAATVLYAGCGGGGSAPAPAPEAPAAAAEQETVALSGVVYGPAELSGERVAVRTVNNATGRDLPMHGATLTACDMDENGELQPLENAAVTTGPDGSFFITAPARNNIVLVARKEITINGQTRVFTVKAVVLFSAEEAVRHEKTGVSLDAATTLVVESMRDIIMEAKARGKQHVRGADIQPEILNRLHEQMNAALTADQVETAPVVDMVAVTTGQTQEITQELQNLTQTTTGGAVTQTVAEAVQTTEPAPETPAAPAPEIAPEPVPVPEAAPETATPAPVPEIPADTAPVAACVASTQITEEATSGNNGHGHGHRYGNGFTVREMIRYWRSHTDRNWRKHCRSGRGTHCVRVHVIGIQGSGGPLSGAQVTFTADGYSQVETTDNKGNAYFSNVPYATRRDVVAVKSGYKMLRTSRNIKQARSVWNVVVMMGYDDAAPACCADTDCDDADSDTEDACMNPGTAGAVCENTPAVTECSTDADCGGGYCVNGGTQTAACVTCLADAHCDDGDAATIDACSEAGTENASCASTPATCATAADCDDADDYTADACQNPGTAAAACTHEAMACLTDTDCNDGATLTLDACNNAGTTASACAYTAIACSSGADCSDGNNRTEDVCSNPGTAAASCSHPAIACLTDTECDDSRRLTYDICQNPGTSSASCRNDAITCITQDDCSDGNAYTVDICYEPGATTSHCKHLAIACKTNADCDDGYASTIDKCMNPNTTGSYCSRQTIACFSAGDCNDGNPLTIDACANAGSASASCTHTAIVCAADSDCNDGNASTIDKCQNPGTVNAFCTNKVDDGWITIPSGSFPMGCTAGESGCTSDAQPQHQVTLSEYRIMKNSVTNAQYAQCVATGACALPLALSSYSRPSYYGNAAYSDYPVIYVSWSNAEAYCNFTGGHLPTEAQWEKAARGTTARTYPWGEAAPACSLANAYIGSGLCVGDTSKVGSLAGGASPYGAMDMAGNALEWTRDWYDGAYYAASPGMNPTGPSAGSYKVIRGGSWHHNALYLRATFRSVKYPNSASNDITFRCVK